MRRLLLFVFSAFICTAPLSASAEDYSWHSEDDEFGSGFVAIEGGLWRFLGSTRTVVTDPIMIYVTTGFSLTRALGSSNDYEPIKIGPKVGIGIGSRRGIAQNAGLFYDLLCKVRYVLGPKGSRLRPFVDAGPGFVNFERSAFELEAGTGVDLYFGTGSFGINAQYKELFGAGSIKRGVVFLASLGYHF